MTKVFSYDLALIIPVYNGEKYLEGALNKLVKIDDLKIQLIVVDDGSTDDTPGICKAFAEKHNGMIEYYCLKKNKGVSFARNYGIDCARAKFISFLDADDDFDKKIYKVLVSNAIKYNTDIAVCNYYEIEDDKLLRSKYEYKTGVLNHEEAIKAFLLDKIGPTVWDAIFSKEIIDGVRFNENMRVAEDNIFVLELLMKAKNTYVTNQRLYYYRQNHFSTMHKLSNDLNIIDISNFLTNVERQSLVENFPKEYDFWKLQLAAHSVHAIANSTSKSNFKKAEKIINNIDKDYIRRISKNRNFPKLLRIEFSFIVSFGYKVYLRLFPFFRKAKIMLRGV